MDPEVSFGACVTRRRKALDLTLEELAGQIGCSVSGLRKIESDERRPSRQMAELLADHLRVPPEQRPTFLQVARGQRRVERLAAVRWSTWARPLPPQVGGPKTGEPSWTRSIWRTRRRLSRLRWTPWWAWRI